MLDLSVLADQLNIYVFVISGNQITEFARKRLNDCHNNSSLDKLLLD